MPSLFLHRTSAVLVNLFIAPTTLWTPLVRICIKYVLCCVWLLFLNIVMRRAHTECRCTLSFSLHSIYIVWIFHNVFIQHVADGHLGTFQFEALMKRAGMNISFEYTPMHGINESKYIYSTLGFAEHFYKVVVPVYVPSSKMSSGCTTNPSTFSIVYCVSLQSFW